MPADKPQLPPLFGHLWEAANILRGPVDAADFKTYVFPLLFFKRLSDVYDEEVRKALDDSEGDEAYAHFPENHRFQVPDNCHWDDVRGTTTDVGKVLQFALHEIEKANPKTLFGIFGDAPWTNKDRLSDELLTKLLEHFSELPLTLGKVPSDALGDAYEYLIKQFADKANKKAGEFYTPRSVVRLMTRILAPKAGETIYDPACGTGGMLLAAVEYVRDHGGDVRTLLGRLFGQEKNLTTSAIARMNLLLHEVDDALVARGDTLREPAFLDGDELMRFDCVVANPPFSLEKWGHEKWASDPFRRNLAGTPPAKSGDYAWVQHMLASMKPGTGRMGVVLPHGALFRMASEGKIRKKILEMDLLEAVIGLGPNLFYGTGLAACVLVFRMRKAEARKRQILIVDASRLFRKGRNQNELLQRHADRIFQLYSDYATGGYVELLCRPGPRDPQDHTVLRHFVPDYFAVQPSNRGTDAQAFPAFVRKVIGLRREKYKLFMSCLTTFFAALEALGANFDLAYSMYVYLLEALEAMSE